jgi:hypothetical protein
VNVTVSVGSTSYAQAFATILRTDSNGDYSDSGLLGTYRISFAANETGLGQVISYGFLPVFYNEKTSWEQADPVTVAEGQTTRVDAVLHHPGVITGRATDPSGKPLSGICVGAGTVIQPSQPGLERKEGGGAGEAVTDSNGDYRLSLQRAGYSPEGSEGGEIPYNKTNATVIVSFRRTELLGGEQASCTAGYYQNQVRHQVWVFYAQKSNESTADVVTVPRDTTVSNINAVLTIATTVPNVVGKKLTAAKRAVIKAGLTVGKIVRRHASPGKRDKVLTQSIKPGKKVPAKTRINLLVGK